MQNEFTIDADSIEQGSEKVRLIFRHIFNPDNRYKEEIGQNCNIKISEKNICSLKGVEKCRVVFDTIFRKKETLAMGILHTQSAMVAKLSPTGSAYHLMVIFSQNATSSCPGTVQKKEPKKSNMRLASFDIEIAKGILEFENWKDYSPIGITCAAVAFSDIDDVKFWNNGAQLERHQCVGTGP